MVVTLSTSLASSVTAAADIRVPASRRNLSSCSWLLQGSDGVPWHSSTVRSETEPSASVSLTLAPNFAGYTASTSGLMTMATLPASLRMAGSLTASG